LSHTAVVNPPDAFARGMEIGKYLVVDRLGAGGAGVVVSAFDPDLNRKIAIKVMRGRVTDAARTRLVREAQALAQLDHPNVITVYEVGIFDDEMFIAMEFAEQGTLRHWLAAKPRAWREILDRYIDAGRGLAAAHAAKLVHRDFKPDNVLVTASERVKVSDFGLVSATGEQATLEGERLAPTTPLDVSLTHTGMLIGTPSYMAPEQHLLGRVDARADQFAFCVALYEALYGVRPFEGADYYSLFTSVSEGRIVSAPRSSVPIRILKAIHRGLASDPAARWPSMDALLAELQRDRKPVARWIAVGAVAAITTAAVTLYAAGGSSSELEPCAAGPRRLAGVWDLGIKQKIRAAFATSGAPTHAEDWRAVERVVDGHTDAWIAAERENCEATRIVGTQPEHAFEVREACLDNRLSQIARLSSLWQSTRDGNVVRSATTAAIGLDDIAICRDASGLADWLPPPADETSKQAIAGVRQRIMDGRGLMLAERFDQARASVAPLSDEANQIGYPPLVAETMLINARLAWLTNDKLAEQRAFDAAVSAQGTRHYEIAIEAWTLLAEMASFQAHAADAKRWLRVAGSLAEPLGDDPLRRAGLLQAEARIDVADGKLDDARGELERASRIYDDFVARGRGDLMKARHQLAAVLSDLGQTLFSLGRNAAAEPVLERSVALFDALYGPRNPLATEPLNVLAGVSYVSGRYDKAQQVLERIVDTGTLYLPEPNAKLASYHTNLGEVLRAEGRYEEALGHIRRGLEMRRKLYGDDDPQLVPSYMSLAAILENQQRRPDARAAAERAVAIAEHSFGDSSLKTAAAFLTLGLIQHDLGQDDEAGGTYRHALRIYEQVSPDHHDVATLHNRIGVSLHAQGKNRDALAEFHLALARYERLDPIPDDEIRITLDNLAETVVETGAVGDAIAPLERSLAILEKDQAGLAASRKRSQLALTHLHLAEVLWDSQRDRRRAIREATTALAVCTTKDCDRTPITEWLASHR
jgi:tetratricopeptide (TPR) repeat protein